MYVNDLLETAAKIVREVDNGMKSSHCAILANKGKILSVGINKRKTHPRMMNKHNNRRFLHAEVAALINANPNDLKNATLYVVRIGKGYNSDKMRLSKPCEFCQAAILHAKIKHVYYSISDNTVGHWNVRQNTWETITKETDNG